MSMSITGLGSGFDINGWVSSLVSVKKSTLVTPLESRLSSLQSTNSSLSSIKSKYSTLQSSLKAFTDIVYNSSSDMWANTKVKSSDSDYVSASSSGLVSAANVDVVVKQIATSTVASSYKSLGTGATIGDAKFTSLANNQAKEGNFSLFLDGKKYEIEIEKDDTLNQVIEKINDLGKEKDEEGNIIEGSKGVFSASIEDGILSIKPKNENAKLVLGSSGDTSNIVSAFKLYEKDKNGFKSAYAVSKLNTSTAMASEESGLEEITFSGENDTGKIKINGVEFDVDKNTTLDSLISKINGNSDAHVKASFDSLTNRFILTATETGASNIALEGENTNLLNVLGLTVGEGENERLHEDSQVLGENAIVKIGDNEIVSNSNTITGASSGISNLSITVKKPTTGKDDVPASVHLDIEADYSKVKDALQKFVDAYNDVVSTTKSAVASDGAMAHDSSLNSILNTIKSITSTTSENDGKFNMLAQIGISTSSSDPTKLSIDSSKLEEALKSDFESVKYLLSDGSTKDENTGLFDKLLKNVNTVLDVENGYFATKTESIDSQIKLTNTRIERANTQLSKYEARVTTKFNRMDSIMSQLSSQLTTFQAYIR